MWESVRSKKLCVINDQWEYWCKIFDGASVQLEEELAVTNETLESLHTEYDRLSNQEG